MKTETITIGSGERSTSRDEVGGLVLVAVDSPGSAPRAIAIPEDGLFVGREPPSSGLAIAQTSVSRIHARVFRKDGAVRVRDVDSRNGTIVRGRRIAETTLHEHDLVRFGNAVYTLVERGFGDHLVTEPPGPLAEGLVGGPRMSRILRELGHVATTDLPILVLGETGTGKERIAHMAHAASGRRGRLCAINCAAIPATLFESELFGYRRGAFTGADRDKMGLVRAAHEGTLMLDEIGDMPIEAQAKLLRLLETREVVPLGATSGEPVDVHLVSATHHDLDALVRDGRFRGDLLARIRGQVVRLPPLRHRKEEIVPLVRHFLARAGSAEAAVAFDCWVALCQYDWPFNVRELDTAVRRALAVAQGAMLEPRHLPETVQEPMRGYGDRASPLAEPASVTAASRSPESAGRPPSAPNEATLRADLERENGNVAAIARLYRRDRAQVHRWLRRFGLVPDSFRNPEREGGSGS